MHSIRITVVDLPHKKFVAVTNNIAFIKKLHRQSKKNCGFENRKMIVEIENCK